MQKRPEKVGSKGGGEQEEAHFTLSSFSFSTPIFFLWEEEFKMALVAAILGEERAR